MKTILALIFDHCLNVHFSSKYREEDEGGCPRKGSPDSSIPLRTNLFLRGADSRNADAGSPDEVQIISVVESIS